MPEIASGGTVTLKPVMDAEPQQVIVTSSFRVRRLTTLAFSSSLTVMLLLAVGVGAVEMSPMQVLSIIFHKLGFIAGGNFTDRQESVLLAIRLPRVLLGLAVGAGLAVSGAVLQALFKNPLADPALIGVSSGASLAVAIFIVFGETFAAAFLLTNKTFLLPIAAFAGGLAATVLVYRLGKRRSGLDAATMLLAGIAVNAFVGAGIGLMSFAATDAQLRNITFWSLGSLAGATWSNVALAVPLILLAVFLILRLSRQLNVLLLGEAEARHLGVNVGRLKWQAIALVALAVGAGVSVTGAIGFVGLVVPHLLRLTTGSDHRFLLVNSALLGANLLLAADLLARTILIPAEVPIGIITALIGAPFFMWLLFKKA